MWHRFTTKWKHFSIWIERRTNEQTTQHPNKSNLKWLFSTSIRIGSLRSWVPRCRIDDPGHTQGFRRYQPHSKGIEHCRIRLVIGRGGCCLRRWTVFLCHLYYGTHARVVAIRTKGDYRPGRFGIGNVIAVSEQCTVKREGRGKKYTQWMINQCCAWIVGVLKLELYQLVTIRVNRMNSIHQFIIWSREDGRQHMGCIPKHEINRCRFAKIINHICTVSFTVLMHGKCSTSSTVIF